LDNLELAYYAGLFDGEGCVAIEYNNNSKGLVVVYNLYCRLTMTNKDLVYSLKDNFGGSVCRHPLHAKNPHHRDTWTWTIVSNQAMNWLKIILPFLRLKREQAKAAIEFQTLRCGLKGSKRVTPEELSKRNYYFVLLKKLKQRV
jgi:hypothetical protein